MKTKTKKNAKRKLYWDQSQMAWLVGIKPFEGENLYSDKTVVEKLSRKLLKVGGTNVCVLFNTPRFISEAIIKHGVVFSPNSIKLNPGEPSNCHQNAGRLWKTDKRAYRLCTGYGLSEDQMWRPHSWLEDKAGNIIETTVPREIYFGVGHTGKGAEGFCEYFGISS